MSDIEARVKKIIAEQLGVPEADVTNEKAFVADVAGMNDRGMSDGRVVADAHAIFVREVHDRAVLHVRALADRDRVDVAAQHATVPHAAVHSERDIAEHGRVRRHERGLGHLWLPGEMARETFLDSHPRIAAKRPKRRKRKPC